MYRSLLLTSSASIFCVDLSQFRDLDSFKFRVIIFVSETLSFDCVLLHFMIVKGTDSVNVSSGSQFLKELFGVVDFKNFLDTVKVFSDIVLVLENVQGLVNLPLHTIFKLLII